MSLRDEISKIMREEDADGEFGWRERVANRVEVLAEQEMISLRAENAGTKMLLKDMANEYLEVRHNGTFYNSPIAYRVNEALGINAPVPCPKESIGQPISRAEAVEISGETMRRAEEERCADCAGLDDCDSTFCAQEAETKPKRNDATDAEYILESLSKSDSPNTQFAALFALTKLRDAGIFPKPRTVMRIEIEGPVPNGPLFLCYGDTAQYLEIKAAAEVDE